MVIWRYKLEHDFICECDALLGIVYQNEWVSIKSGRMHIRKTYAWDGCTPSYPVKPFFGLILPRGAWVGVWDGPLGIDGRPASWKASLCHDVLCQFRPSIAHITKEDTVKVFKTLLKLNHAPWWMVWLYPLAVSLLGPQQWGDPPYSPV